MVTISSIITINFQPSIFTFFNLNQTDFFSNQTYSFYQNSTIKHQNQHLDTTLLSYSTILSFFKLKRNQPYLDDEDATKFWQDSTTNTLELTLKLKKNETFFSLFSSLKSAKTLLPSNALFCCCNVGIRMEQEKKEKEKG